MPHPVDMAVDTGGKGDLWMDAIEAEKRGDREESLRVCRELVIGEPDNSDAWMMIARMEPVSYTHLTLPTIYSV